MATWDTLLKQASDTAQAYMIRAKYDINEQFGEGYAKDHPELVAAYMKVAAMDFQTMAKVKIAEGDID